MKTQNSFLPGFIARNLVRGLLAAIFCLLPAQTRAEIYAQAWVQRYDGPGNGDDYATDIAVDTNGNVFVTGVSTRIANSNYTDYATIKYSGSGVALWTNRYHGRVGGYNVATAMAVDASGDVFVTGHSASIADSPDNYGYVTIKYSEAGVPLWTNRYHGAVDGNSFASAIAVDHNENVFVTGWSDGDEFADYATIKYSGAGVPLWTNRYDGPGDDGNYAQAIALDESGNVFVTGYASGASSDYATVAYSGAGVPLWTNGYARPGRESSIAVDRSGNVFVTGGNGYATVKYSGAGVGLWTNRYDDPGNFIDLGHAIAVDGDGNVLVTGSSYGSNTTSDYTTIAYSSAGMPLWTNRYNGPGNDMDEATAIAVDGRSNVVVTGYSYGTNSSRDYATIAYSSAGVPLWTNRYNGPGNFYDYPTAIAVDRDGNVFVTGYSVGTNYDYATIKYSIVRPIPLDVQRMNNQVVLSWTSAAFGLQSAPAITGAFTNVPSATSPYTNAVTSLQQYFRLISN